MLLPLADPCGSACCCAASKSRSGAACVSPIVFQGTVFSALNYASTLRMKRWNSIRSQEWFGEAITASTRPTRNCLQRFLTRKAVGRPGPHIHCGLPQGSWKCLFPIRAILRGNGRQLQSRITLRYRRQRRTCSGCPSQYGHAEGKETGCAVLHHLRRQQERLHHVRQGALLRPLQLGRILVLGLRLDQCLRAHGEIGLNIVVAQSLPDCSCHPSCVDVSGIYGSL